MKLNISSESVFRSSYSKGNFELDPNRMIQLMFSLDKSLNRFVQSWNSNIYMLLKELMQDANDIDAWKVGLSAYSIPLTTDIQEAKNWWNINKERPYTILESLELVAKDLTTNKLLLTKISKLTTPVINKYLINSFVSLLDTPSDYLRNSLVQYDPLNKELNYVPFSGITLTGPSTFLSLDDTPVAFNERYLLGVNTAGDELEFKPPGLLTRRSVTALTAGSFNVSTLTGTNNVLVCDDSAGVININLDGQNASLNEVSTITVVFSIVLNGINLVPTGSYTYENSGSTVALTNAPLTLFLDPITTTDYRQIGEHV